MTASNQQEVVQFIKDLRKALFLFEERMDNDSDEAKSPREKGVHNIVNTLSMKLGRWQAAIERGDTPGQEQPQSPEDSLAEQMLSTVNSLVGGHSVINKQTADQFGQALKLLDIASTAKNAAETAIVNDKRKKLS